MGSRATQRVLPQVIDRPLLSVATRSLTWIVAIAFVAVAIALVFRSAPQAERTGLDALYCGGRLVVAGINPYLFHPMAWCERNIAGPYTILAPAPQPPYDLAAIALLTTLSFRIFALIVFTIMAAAFAIAASILGRVSRLPLPIVAGAFVPLAFVCARSGELFIVVCLSALCVSSFYLSTKRYAAAAFALAVAMCEPQLALPAGLSLLLWVPRSRLSFVISVAALCAISFGVAGADVNRRYVFGELPRHVRAELAFPGQYGLLWFFHALGARTDIAVALSALTSLFALVVAVVLARRLAEIWQRREAIVLVPPLAALCAGISLHAWDMILALPAALFIVSQFRKYRWLSFIALALVAIPWQFFSVVPSRTPGMASAMAALHVFPPDALSSTYWQVYLQELYARLGVTFADFAWKIPTWAGLALLAGCVVGACVSRRKRIVSAAYSA